MRAKSGTTTSLPAILTICAAAIAPTACGDDRPAPAALDSCRAGWQPLTASQRFLGPRTLVHHDGELIYDADVLPAVGPAVPRIEAQSVMGGAPRVIAEAVNAWTLWVEGDQVLFAMNATLSRVPVSGGTPPVVLADASAKAGEPPREIFGHVLSPTDLVWWERASGPDTAQVWAMPRAGGELRKLATIPGLLYFERMELFGRAVTLASADSSAFVVPLDGGDVRSLAAVGTRLAGVEADGVYGFAAKTPFDPTFERFEVHVAPPDGGAARAFWPDLPPQIAPDGIWADGDGGWLASALQTFDDGLVHRSVFWIDALGTATLAACDASPTNLDGTTVRPAFTPDAAFMVVDEVSEPAHATWRIVKIPRR
jgi:hypothetical protein